MILDFSEAQAKMKDDENKRRVEEGLTVGLSKEVSLWVVVFYWSDYYFLQEKGVVTNGGGAFALDVDCNA